VIALSVPYHLDEWLEQFSAGIPVDTEVTVDLPRDGPWQRMAVLYEHVARAVADSPTPPVVVSGDCTTSLGVLAGLQRAGHDAGIVWFDAHADFHTEQTTTSGYLGGMPLALAVGVGTLTLPDALGLRPVPPARALLVDARDTDPPEHVLLRQHGLTVRAATELNEVDLPPGELYLHVDLDVCDPRDVPDLLYPAPGGPGLDEVTEAVRRVAATGRVAAVGLAATWRHSEVSAAARREVVRRVLDALGS
jgi:arginase